MNIHQDKKIVFMCHPQTGEKEIAEYFGSLGFEKKIGNSYQKLSRKSISYNFLYPWDFDDHKLIVSIDNPYRRIVNEYKKFSHTNWSLKKHTKEELYERFNLKFTELFSDDLWLVDKKNRESETVYNFLLPYDFGVKSPDYIIRKESLVEDIYNIDVLDHTSFDFHLLNQLDLSEKYKDVFSYNNARVIYKVHRHIFDMMDYDPFSFTTRDLTREERIKFIHY
jgi:hypothetical protein